MEKNSVINKIYLYVNSRKKFFFCYFMPAMIMWKELYIYLALERAL